MQQKTFSEWLATPLGFISVLGGCLFFLLAVLFAVLISIPVVPGSVRPAPARATTPTVMPSVLPTPEPTAEPAPPPPTPEPVQAPEPVPTPEPVTFSWPEGQIVLGVGCPEGWCIVALDPVSGHRETIGSFEEGPFEVQRESRDSPTLRSRHDPALERSLYVNNWGSTIFGWVDRFGNVTDLYDRLPVSEFARARPSVKEVWFDEQGTLWATMRIREQRTEKTYRVDPGSTTPIEAEWAPRKESRTCGIANDRQADTCVGVAGRVLESQWIAVMDAYEPKQAIMGGVDRTSEMLDIRGRPITEKTSRTLRMPVLSPDGEQVAFLAFDVGNGCDLYVTGIDGGAEPRKVTTLAPSGVYTGLFDWRRAPES